MKVPSAFSSSDPCAGPLISVAVSVLPSASVSLASTLPARALSSLPV